MNKIPVFVNEVEVKEPTQKEIDGLDFDKETHGGPTPSIDEWITKQINNSKNV